MHICQDEILPIILYLGPLATMLWFSVRMRLRSWMQRWRGRDMHANCNHDHSKPS